MSDFSCIFTTHAKPSTNTDDLNHSFYKYNNTDDGLKTRGRTRKDRRRREILTGKDDGWKAGFHERGEGGHSSKMHPCVLVISVAHMGLDLKSFPYFLMISSNNFLIKQDK